MCAGEKLAKIMSLVGEKALQKLRLICMGSPSSCSLLGDEDGGVAAAATGGLFAMASVASMASLPFGLDHAGDRTGEGQKRRKEKRKKKPNHAVLERPISNFMSDA